MEVMLRRVILVSMILVLALAPLSSVPSSPPSTTPSVKLAESPMLTLTEDELRGIVKKAVDEAVDSAVAIALKDYAAKHATEVAKWKGAASLAALATVAALVWAAVK